MRDKRNKSGETRSQGSSGRRNGRYSGRQVGESRGSTGRHNGKDSGGQLGDSWDRSGRQGGKEWNKVSRFQMGDKLGDKQGDKQNAGGWGGKQREARFSKFHVGNTVADKVLRCGKSQTHRQSATQGSQGKQAGKQGGRQSVRQCSKDTARHTVERQAARQVGGQGERQSGRQGSKRHSAPTHTMGSTARDEAANKVPDGKHLRHTVGDKMGDKMGDKQETRWETSKRQGGKETPQGRFQISGWKAQWRQAGRHSWRHRHAVGDKQSKVPGGRHSAPHSGRQAGRQGGGQSSRQVGGHNATHSGDTARPRFPEPCAYMPKEGGTRYHPLLLEIETRSSSMTQNLKNCWQQAEGEAANTTADTPAKAAAKLLGFVDIGLGGKYRLTTTHHVGRTLENCSKRINLACPTCTSSNFSLESCQIMKLMSETVMHLSFRFQPLWCPAAAAICQI